MGCGCTGFKMGTDPSNPFLIGEDDGSPIRRVLAVVNGFGIRRGEVGFVVGSGVDAMLSAGWIRVPTP